MSSSPLRPQRSTPHKVARSTVQQRFSRAACTYDRAATLQRGIAERLLGLVHRHLPAPHAHEHWVDLGCGTGYLTHRLRQRHPGPLWAVDLSHDMLMKARQRCTDHPPPQWVQADALSLPFPAGSIDRLYSNLALQWAGELAHVLDRLYHALAPGGWLAMTTLDADTLWELHRAQHAAGGHLSGHRFHSAAAMQQALDQSPFLQRAHHRQAFVQYYANVRHVIQGLKQLGAQSQPDQIEPGLKGRQWLSRLEAHAQAVMQPEGMPARYTTHFLIVQKPFTASPQESS